LNEKNLEKYFSKKDLKGKDDYDQKQATKIDLNSKIFLDISTYCSV
jgi:hypothetical protein